MPGESEQDEHYPAEPPSPANSSPPGAGENAGGYGLVGIGFEFVAAICLVGLLGWWIDGKLNTFPWLTASGAALGFAAGLTQLIRAGRRAFKD
jgi:F0F1-type ATP synthase assembly protein I